MEFKLLHVLKIEFQKQCHLMALFDFATLIFHLTILEKIAFSLNYSGH